MAYAEIFDGIISGIAASSIFTPVKYAVEQYMVHGQEVPQEEHIEQPLVSIPLAIGYYYNMIKKLERQMYDGSLSLYRSVEQRKEALADKLGLNSEQIQQLTSDELEFLNKKTFTKRELIGEFPVDNVTLKLIYPKNLQNRTINNCSKFLRSETQKAFLNSYESGRDYGLNYIENSESADAITLVDYARPIEAIPKFYQEMHGIGGMGTDNDAWVEIEENEMQAFLYSIQYLVENRSTLLYDKVCFEPIS